MVLFFGFPRFQFLSTISLLGIVFVSGIFADTSISETSKISLDFKPGFIVASSTKFYVGDIQGNTVSVLDKTKETITKVIPVGLSPVTGIIVGTNLYILNFQGNSVSVIDTITDTVTKTLLVESGPKYLKLVNKSLFVSNFLSDSVSIINTDTQSYTQTIPVGSNPTFMNYANGRLYVSNSAGTSLAAINITTPKLAGTITTGLGPAGSVLLGRNLYINNSKNKSVTIIDTGDLIATQISEPKVEIPVGAGPTTSTATSTKVYVNNLEDGTVSVIDTTKNQVIKTITVGSNPGEGLLVGTNLYIYNTGSNSVSIIDTVSDTLKKNVTVGLAPVGFTLSGNRIYVINKESKDISIIYTAPPVLTNISSNTPNGSYDEDKSIDIRATFDQPLAVGSTMVLLLNNNASVTLSNIQGQELFGEYRVKAGENSSDLSAKSITSAKIIGISEGEKTSYTIPASKNLGDLKNIVIKTSAPSTTIAEPLCKDTGLYRKCPVVSLNNITEYRTNLICEGFITEAQAQRNMRRISRLEVLQTAINMLRTEKAPYTEYENTYTDIVLGEDNQETVSLVQTALKHGLISPNNGAFEASKSITRIEAYAILMAGVCLTPQSAVESDIARTIHQLAVQEGITSKPWARFRAKDIITRSEVFILVSRLVDWADKNGGCQALACTK